jgi:hypothetical protein
MSLNSFAGVLRSALPTCRPSASRPVAQLVSSGPSSSRWASTSTEQSSHGPYITLGELANNKGATKTVSSGLMLLVPWLVHALSVTSYRTSVSDEDGHLRKEGRPVEVTKDRRLELGMESPRRALKEDRRQSPACSRSEGSTICTLATACSDHGAAPLTLSPCLDSTSKEYAPLNLPDLQAWIASGRLDASQAIDVGSIFRSNLVHGIKGWSGVKLLGEVSRSALLEGSSEGADSFNIDTRRTLRYLCHH